MRFWIAGSLMAAALAACPAAQNRTLVLEGATLIQGDPLADIAATRTVRMVIKDGAVVDTSYDPAWVNPIPRRTGRSFPAPQP